MAQHCAQQLLEQGAVVLALSDSQGYVYEPAGLTREQLEQVRACAECAPVWGSVGQRKKGVSVAAAAPSFVSASGTSPCQACLQCTLSLLPSPRQKLTSKQIKEIKRAHDGRLAQYRGSPAAQYVPGGRVWAVDAQLDMAFPCATQVGAPPVGTNCWRSRRRQAAAL